MNTKQVPFNSVRITGGFWAEKQKMNHRVTMPSVEQRFRETGRFDAFKFIYYNTSDIPRPHYFWDSDVAKWLEAAMDIYALEKDEELKAKVDEVVSDIEKNRMPDGYFNIFHQIVEPGTRFSNRDHHELYCLGHLIEAACAYLAATGSMRFFDALDGYIDLVIKVFSVERSANFLTPGHEEIELALVKAYRLTNREKYLSLAKFFIDERGNHPWEHCNEWAKINYNQSHMPVREQREAYGHSVRAHYLYCGMADVAAETGDKELADACKAIFDDITLKKMYVTGGAGSSHNGEAYTIAYDLPADTAYTETCASLALAFFANRMKELELDSKYADTVETVLYNNGLSGVSLDGSAFFYENPLEIILSDRGRHTSVYSEDRLPITQRCGVFSCSCCPPNINRFLAAIGEYVFSAGENAIILHQYMNCEADICGAKVSVETNYPADGRVKVRVRDASGKKLYVRVPGWCRDFAYPDGITENGYLILPVESGDESFEFDFVMKPRFIAGNPLVRACAGRTAVAYGPVVYCMEGVDNPYPLSSYVLDTKSEAVYGFEPAYGAGVITLDACVSDPASFPGLYADISEQTYKKVKAKLIPYFAFANRGESDMLVWCRYI